MKGWTCKNCGEEHQDSDTLEGLGFTWTLGGIGTKLGCPCCGAYVLSKAYAWNDFGMPTHGEFLVIRTTTNHLRSR